MGKIVAPIIVIMGAIFVWLLMPNTTDSITDFRTDSRVNSFAVTTGVGVTNATVTLGESLWQSQTQSVTAVTSDVASDNPIADSYASAAKNLTVRGLTANTSRNLSVTYYIGGLTNYTGADTFGGIVPLVIGIALLIIMIGAGIAMFMNR